LRAAACNAVVSIAVPSRTSYAWVPWQRPRDD
jgi:hypothetical protein